MTRSSTTPTRTDAASTDSSSNETVALPPRPSPIDHHPESEIASGEILGRYVLLGELGQGGMATVYRAYDPKLRREVALKVLKLGLMDDDEAHARTFREAQAMAQLSHPNVMPVYDVERSHGTLFIAMEYVAGSTLRAWTRERSRPWREILACFLQAGRGLAAAHRAGLVHRDFKPTNAMIGDDGRVRVMDFGLVAATAIWRDLPSRPPNAGLDVADLTEAGIVMGTPAYMSPEQHRHGTVDARSDQYSFSLALYEALYGHRPFDAAGSSTLLQLKEQGPAATPEQSRGPKRLYRAIARGLAPEPSDRWGSMQELLDRLDREVTGRRRLTAVVVAMAALGLGGAAVAYSRVEQRDESSHCLNNADLDDVWDDARRSSIRRSFTDTGLAYADQTAVLVIERLDRFTDLWEHQRRLLCNAQTAKVQGPGVLALREACVQRARTMLEFLIEVFERSDAQMVARAVSAVSNLPPVKDCADIDVLTTRLPPPPPSEHEDVVAEKRRDLSRVQVLLSAGRYDDALPLARRLDDDSVALGYLPLQAEARLQLGRSLDLRGEANEARGALEQAALLAVAGRHRHIAAQALANLVYVLGVTLPEFDAAERAAAQAQAEIEGLGGDDSLEAMLWTNRGSLATRRGHHDEALVALGEALRRRDPVAEPLRWADVTLNMAVVRYGQRDNLTAIEGVERYIEVYERELGAWHPEVAAGYHNLAEILAVVGRLDEAEIAVRRTEQILGKTLGIDHPAYARALGTHGRMLVQRGSRGLAVRVYRRARTIVMNKGGDELHQANRGLDIAFALVGLGLGDDARKEATDAMAVIEQVEGIDGSLLAHGYLILAMVAALEDDLNGMRAYMEQAQAIGPPPLSLESEEQLHDFAQLLAQEGQREEAIQILRRLIGRHDFDHHPQLYVPSAYFLLATLLVEQPESRGAAVQMARVAARQMRVLQADTEVIEAWFREQDLDDATETGDALGEEAVEDLVLTEDRGP